MPFCYKSRTQWRIGPSSCASPSSRGAALFAARPPRRTPRITAPGAGVRRRSKRDVDAVGDPDELAGVRAEVRVEPEAEGRLADLPRVRRADRRHEVGAHDGALHEVERAVVEEPLVGEVVVRDAQAPRQGRGRLPLVAEVVDREDEARGGPPLVGGERARVAHGEGGVPVVRVDDVRGPAEGLAGDVERAAREQREAALVVAEGAVGVAVDALAIAVEAVVHEQADAVAPARARRPRGGLEHAAPHPVVRAEAVVHVERRGPVGGAVRHLRRAVARCDDDDVHAQLGEREAERLDHVAEPARPRERRDLGGDGEHAERDGSVMPSFYGTRRGRLQRRAQRAGADLEDPPRRRRAPRARARRRRGPWRVRGPSARAVRVTPVAPACRRGRPARRPARGRPEPAGDEGARTGAPARARAPRPSSGRKRARARERPARQRRAGGPWRAGPRTPRAPWRR